ncbi:MAG: Spy/CpxP family protein refolding chaperone [Bacteroidota bacterium]
MASYADPNGYPGPKHIVELRDTLQLSEDQTKDIESIFDDMSENAQNLGVQIIKLEEDLHRLFALGKAEESDMKKRTEDIGRLRGELRAVHLAAHIRARGVLTKEQVDLYTTLRHPEGKVHRVPGMHHKESK